MKIFQQKEQREAVELAKQGGEALHLFSKCLGFPNIPECFRKADEWAHLFDQDVERLIKTARKLGVRNIKVGRKGEEGQHIDLCGAPLRKALELAEKENI